MLLGIAGTYRKNDKIDVVFTVDGRPKVVPLAAAAAARRSESRLARGLRLAR